MLHYHSRPPERPWTSSPSQRSRSRPKWPQTTRTCLRSTQTVLQGGAQRTTDASSPSSNTDYIHPVLTLYFMFSSSVIGTPRQGSPRPAAFCKWTTTRRSVEPTGGPSWRICIVPTSSCGRRTHTHTSLRSHTTNIFCRGAYCCGARQDGQLWRLRTRRRGWGWRRRHVEGRCIMHAGY